MTGKGMKWMWSLALAIPFATQAQVDLAALDRDMTGPRAQVLVLATVHLNELPKEFQPSALGGVVDRLVAFKPEIITIESISGEECDLVLRHPTVYGADFCASTDAARAATGLDVPAAIAQVRKTLKDWPAQPTPAQRRQLAAYFLAANDTTSAYVQWLQLPPAERRTGDGLDAALVEKLEKTATLNDERYQIAAPVAARLGLQRVHAIDNHTGDNLDITDVKSFAQSLQQAWDSGKGVLAQRERQGARLATQPDLLPLYRHINAVEHQQALARMNIAGPMRSTSPQQYPQQWVAGWEIRNLRMVANVRETFRERPAARVLTIVGASHKPWFDAWLGQLQGVDIVDAGAVLR